jgi:hypothetical protein
LEPLHSAAGARAICPYCGAAGESHPTGPCLDRWVHTSFLQRALRVDEEAPPYSRFPAQRCFDDVLHAERWPDVVAVMQTALGCTVGRRVGRSADYHHYDVIAAGETLPLAVCRAAACVGPDGRHLLEIK